MRTIAEANSYAYAVSDKGIYCNLYGGNTLKTKLFNSDLHLTQETDYPWDGKISIKVDKSPKQSYSLFLRIPEWADNVFVTVNGKEENVEVISGSYAEINRSWKKGDFVELNIPFHARIIESNPLVEETRNQVAVMYGPMVYCMESKDLPVNVSIYDVLIPYDIQLQPKPRVIEGSRIITLQGKAKRTVQNNWNGKLYREIRNRLVDIDITLVPYYAWHTRGDYDM